MKKMTLRFYLLAILSGLLTNAFADNDVGCGLGTLIFAGSSGKIPKLLALTTNGTFANQFFGVTFGTLGCNGSGTITKLRVTQFIHGNIDNLARDIARGSGETFDTLSNLWGITDNADRSQFVEIAQSYYDFIFTSEQVDSNQVFTNLNQLISKTAFISQYTLL